MFKVPIKTWVASNADHSGIPVNRRPEHSIPKMGFQHFDTGFLIRVQLFETFQIKFHRILFIL